MATTSTVLSKSDIKAALIQAALVANGIDPATPGLVVVVKLAEEVDVLTGRSCQATVTVITPG
jgi:hypothetical protein